MPAGAAVGWVAVAQPTAERLAALPGFGDAWIRVVPNGAPTTAVPNGAPTTAVPNGAPAAHGRADRRDRLRLPAGAPLLLFAGRLDPAKGADLLPALAAGARARCGAVLVALGDGSLGPALRRAAARLPGRPLRVLGPVDDVAGWMAAADLLLLPSRLEGCPLVFLEAAQCRLPVIATAAALEAWGDAADLAALVSDGASHAVVVAMLDAIEARLRWPDAARVAAAAALAAEQTEAAMLRGLSEALLALPEGRA